MTVESDQLQHPSNDHTIWVFGSHVNDNELNRLQTMYELHETDIVHCKRTDTKRPRFIVHPHYVAFSLYYFTTPNIHIKPVRVDFILGKHFLLTLCSDQVLHIDTMVMRAKEEDILASGIELVLYYIVQGFIQSFAALVTQVILDAEHVSDHLNQQTNLFLDIRETRHTAFTVLQLLAPQARIFNILGTDSFTYTSIQNKAYFIDLSDRTEELIDDLDTIRDNLLSNVEGYTSLQSNEMNRVMKILTVAATIFLPLNLIASIYGMNFKIPEYGWTYGYPYSLSLMGVVAGISILIIHRKGWF